MCVCVCVSLPFSLSYFSTFTSSLPHVEFTQTDLLNLFHKELHSTWIVMFSIDV